MLLKSCKLGSYPDNTLVKKLLVEERTAAMYEELSTLMSNYKKILTFCCILKMSQRNTCICYFIQTELYFSNYLKKLIKRKFLI